MPTRAGTKPFDRLDDAGQYDAAVNLAINPTVDQNGAPAADDFGSFDELTANGTRGRESGDGR